MPRLRTSYCEHEGGRLTGAPVRVRVEDMGAGVGGRAAWDGEVSVIRLSPWLLGDAKALAMTFWHECQHLRLGHVGRLTPSVAVAELPPLVRALAAADYPAREAAADAYAAQRWAALGEHAAIVASALFLESEDDGR